MLVRIFSKKPFIANVCNQAHIISVLKCNLTSVNYLSSLQSAKNSSPTDVLPNKTVQDYKRVYKSSFIRVAGIVGRSKLYQSWLTGIAIPTSFALEYAGIISHETALPFAVVGLAATLATYSIGTLCHRLVGFIYISSDNSKVKISHLDFWGRRVDNIYQTADIIPLSELPDKPSSMYINVKCYSSMQDSLKLSLKYGEIEDMDLFRQIFGYAIM